MSIRRDISLVVLVLAASSAHAQTLEKAFVRAEPLQYSTKEGKFRGCGVNIKVLQEGTTATRDYFTVSINVWLDNPSFALVKSAYKRAAMTTGVVVPSGLDRSWTRIKGLDPLPQTGVTAGDEQALLSWVGLKEAMEYVGSVMSGKEELQVGFYAKGAKLERVFHGVPKWDEGAIDAVQACFDELSDRLGKQKP